MRIVSIAISNYRQYRELKLDFVKPGKDGFDLNVLIGKNGFGKTNLANALCWCLWNREPDLALKEKNSGRPIYNLAAMEEVQAKHKLFLEVSVAIRIDLEDKARNELLVNRKVSCRPSGFVDIPSLALLKCAKVGKSVSFSGQEAQDEINRYYPSDLSDYLMFDGERLTTYFQTGQAAKIRQSVMNLSGVQKLDEAMRHHDIIMDELSGKMSDMSSEMSEAVARRDAAVSAWRQNEEDLNRLEQEVAKGEIVINELKEAISGHEQVPGMIKRRDALQQDLERVEKKILENHQQKCAFIRRYYPLLTVMSIVPTVRAYVTAKRKKDQFPPPIKKDVFERILKEGTCSVCGETLSEKSRKHILSQIDKYNQTVVSGETYSALTELIEPRSIAFTERLKEYLDKRDGLLEAESLLTMREVETEQELQDLNDKLALVNDAEGYQEKIRQLQVRERAQVHNRDLLGACRANRSRLMAEKDTAVKAFEHLNLKESKDELLKRKYELLTESKQIIDLVRHRMITEVRVAIEKKANEYWHALMWKPADEIGEIKLDVNFELKLLDGDQPLIGTLSAAERVMLALSITWAIHSQAGLNFPFFIDTPVSNMSSDSRRDFAKTLKEISKDKQVVLLFTDTEYVADIPEVFGVDVNMQKTLSYNKGVTTIS